MEMPCPVVLFQRERPFSRFLKTDKHENFQLAGICHSPQDTRRARSAGQPPASWRRRMVVRRRLRFTERSPVMVLRNALCYGVIALIWPVCTRTNADAPARLAANLQFDSEAAPPAKEKSGWMLLRRPSSPAPSAESRPPLSRAALRSPSEGKSSAGTSDSGQGPAAAVGASEPSAPATPYLSELNQRLLQKRLQRIEKVRTSLLQRTSGAHAAPTAGSADPIPRPLIPAATGPAAASQPPTASPSSPAEMSLTFPVPSSGPTARPANEPSHEIVIDVPSEDGPPKGKSSLLNRPRNPRSGTP
jgi:hypothetical protein